MTPSDAPAPSHAIAGRAALARGDWDEARSSFEAAIEADADDAEAWEGLATACFWAEDSGRATEAREQAHELYRKRGDVHSMARVSLDLAGDFLEVRGEPAVANGWFQRARRLLDGLPPAPEHALLHVWDAFFALEGELDTDAAIRHAESALELSELVGAPDTAMLARAIAGLARVTAGELESGMSLLDEAVVAALSGEPADPDLICRTCCCMIDACEQVRDYGRAVEWCDHLRAVSTRWRVRSFLTTCRVKYSGVLLWRGDWEAAEVELTAARDHLTATRPASVAGALVRLAEVRRRQGRLDEAEEILDAAGMHPAALPVRAAIALDAGNPGLAKDLLDQLLRRIPERAITERVVSLELKVRAETALGRLDDADEALAEVEAIAEQLGTDPVRATALGACGVVAMARDNPSRARECYEDAAHLFEQSGSPYECARARTGLSEALRALDRADQATAEAAAALRVLEPMGAIPAAKRARALVSAGGPPRHKRILTPRQREVLALAAEGLTDREIGERLFISEYTVHRHISDILTRLDASTRTGAVARALREKLI